MLTSVFLAANRNLTGWHYLAAIVFAAVALLLLVEAYNRAQAKVSWIAIGAIGALATCASLVFVTIPADHHSAAAGGQARVAGPRSVSVTGNDGLELSPRLIPRTLPRLAFYDRISLPKANEGWGQLHRRGGIDVGSANFRLLLANRSTEPISVLNVRVEILESRPPPHGTLVYQFSQGEEGIKQLGAVIDRVRPGTTASVYERSAAMLERPQREKATPYFRTAYILLRPGEVDPASLTVVAQTSRLVRFRLIAEGRSAGRTFVRRSRVYSLVGRALGRDDEKYARTYVNGQFPGVCTATPRSPWYNSRYVYSDEGKPCPSGADAPREIPLSDPTAYARGRFRLDLELRPGAQSATIDGVTVGRPPAAQPADAVALPLLRALGAWSLCVDRWPVPGYWTAGWQAWGLNLVFAGEAGDDCTPRSGSPVREIELWGDRQEVHTDDGVVEIGADPKKIPAAIREMGKVDGVPGEREILLRGASSCDPNYLVDREQVIPGRFGGGILSLAVRREQWDEPDGREGEASEVVRAVTTLPGEEC